MTRRPRGADRDGDSADARTVHLHVHVQPRASRTEVAGPYGDAVKIRITSPPVAGAANEELLRFLAARLRIPRSALAIVGGASSRRKTVRVTDASANEASLVRRLLEGAV